jgi:bifunctional N-acetylglucosamine-1-phosphate-uridyltransferase/glucosamine-1-phosphate-acetyltransferase GlmU-like protein
MSKKLKAVILAAGKGTRMQTDGVEQPKVMRVALGKPLLHYVLAALRFIPPEDSILVVGFKKEAVIAGFPGYPYVEQKVQIGTGHAVMSHQALTDLTATFWSVAGYGRYQK